MYSLIVFLPLFAAIYVGIYNRSISHKLATTITSSSVIASAILSFFAFCDAGIYGEVIHIKLFNWLSIGNFQSDWSIYIDPLSAIMILVVTSVSSVVHLYSSGYMHDDPNIARFMSYLSLFTFCMLMLVLSDNFIQLFFGWEGVGVCSYLLIGFWYKKDSANFAATKAFIVNRVGDFAFILGIMTIYHNFGTVEFLELFGRVPSLETKYLTIFGLDFPLLEVICLLLFIGSMGKSAQIGLHVWLPDAMEGPTPVSALIHAATMVTAGVFLVARCSFLFEFALSVKELIVIIGAVTAVFASAIAICQNDIKKIIAYSTCSQLGYMFIAAGVSCYHASIFHLYTHAFFKAMLFLGAGSVIHAVHEQDIRKMGNLRKFMPITYAIFWLGSLAIMGIFPLSGFYSKDLILTSAFLDESAIGSFAFNMGLIGAFCTAIYSIKIIIKVFHGENNSGHIHTHDLEPPAIMNLPLGFLAIGTVLAGFVGYQILDMKTPIYGFFKESIFIREFEVGEHAPLYIELMPMVFSFAGMFVGYVLFSSKISEYFARSVSILYKIISNKFYFDEIYELVFVKTSDNFAEFCNRFDKFVIDFIGPVLFSKTSLESSKRVASVHNGMVSNYAFLIISSIVITLSILVYKLVL